MAQKSLHSVFIPASVVKSNFPALGKNRALTEEWPDLVQH
jgi:hypothetical protein